MAKMFYTLEEAASKLGTSEQQVKDMAASGQIQQFRDRNKLMFKRDQVDAIAGGGDAAASKSGSGTVIPLADTSDQSDIDAKGDSDATSLGTSVPNGSGSGLNVFDTGEIDTADPAARTRVTDPVEAEEELSLESVGSGSGLLDLTREADDTSLGAELLDEIYPGGDSAAGSGASAVGRSGIFEGELGGTGSAAGTGIDQLGGSVSGISGITAQAAPAGAIPTTTFHTEMHDGPGSGMSTGLLFTSTMSLIIVLIAVVSALGGVHSTLVTWMTTSGGSSSDGMLYGWVGGLVLLSIILLVVGLFIGKSSAGRA
jgi:excisionase family DNA binding protein